MVALGSFIISTIIGFVIFSVSFLMVIKWHRIGIKEFLFYMAFSNIGVGAIFSWTFRDGMGPDSITTYGHDALLGFFRLYWVSFLAGIILMAIALRIKSATRARS